MSSVKFCLLLWLICLALPAFAQNPALGRIVAIDGSPVVEVEITIRATCYNAIESASTGTRTIKSAADGGFAWEVFYPVIDIAQCMNGLEISYNLKKPGFTFSRDQFSFITRRIYYPNTVDDRLPLIFAMANNTPAWITVSAAHYKAPLTDDMIVSGFGLELAAETLNATGTPLPTSLGNRRVLIQDSAGIEHTAKLLFVSPTQVNFITPRGMAVGALILRLLDGNGAVLKFGLGEAASFSVGIFTANATGKGVPAGQIVRVKPGNVQTGEPLAQYDSTAKQYVPLPIDFGPEDHDLYLVLYGTGFRRGVSLSGVTVYVAGLPLEAAYVGSQPSFDGAAQINLKLPRELMGRGDLTVYVRGFSIDSNVVRTMSESNVVQIRTK